MGRKSRRRDYMNAFSQALDIAAEQEVDTVLSTGRLFQSRSPSKSTMNNAREELSKLRERNIQFLIVYGPKETEHQEEFFSNLDQYGLIKHIGGELTQIAPKVYLYGVDAGYEPMVRESHFEDIEDDDFLAVCVGNLDVMNDAEKLSNIDDRIPVSIDVFLVR